MTPLACVIAEEIETTGPMPVARFMELALNHPEFGYYRTRDPLGAAGDFITAPETSQMFGEMIGLWSAVVWEALGAPTPFTLAELGPGHGTLMADALRAGRTKPGFVEAAQLHLVETSPRLRGRQFEALGGFDPVFHDDLAGLPDGPLIVIANEFFDALPVRQLIATEGGWAERCIDRHTGPNGGFTFTIGAQAPVGDLPPTHALDAIPGTIRPGTIYEVSPTAQAIAGELAGRCARAPGAALIIDYGHAGFATGETLQAVRGHAYADPLSDPGTADLTAHVDFGALGQRAHDGGATVFGPIGQARFLLSLGIAARAKRLMAAATAQQGHDMEAALRRLLAPWEMGNLFKVMALASPDAEFLPGFTN
ncbi:MAG: SAM-dependent methyltransferase [Alphaproteobacteria bacterium]